MFSLINVINKAQPAFAGLNKKFSAPDIGGSNYLSRGKINFLHIFVMVGLDPAIHQISICG
jgi:hypothetical protein